MNSYLTATEKLLNQNFGIKEFQQVIDRLESLPEKQFLENYFMDKEEYIVNIKRLGKEINADAELYATAREASKSGSIIESLAAGSRGDIRNEYVRKRKVLVHHLSFFYGSKK